MFALLIGIVGIQRTHSADALAGETSNFLPAISNYVWSGPGIILEPFAAGLPTLTNITHAGDERIFVTTKEGRILLLDAAGNVAGRPFLDLTDRVYSLPGEMGLLGLVFHPDYVNNGSFFVFYSNLDGNSTLSRFSVDPADPDLADPNSEEILLVIEQPTDVHHAGALAFGPADGYLYIASGDGGGAEAALDRESLRGKILRIDVDSGAPYAIPPDNPFAGEPDAAGEVWALGLRNPWRISIDNETGNLFIADVGNAYWEEVNVQPGDSPGGENYGWPCYEASEIFDAGSCDSNESYVFPVHEYFHDNGNCAITGGHVYRGAQYPALSGKYVFADFCSSRLWTLAPGEQNEWQAEVVGQPGLSRRIYAW